MSARSARRVGVVIPAGGSGTRFGGVVPKQFLRLGRKPILQHAIEAFESSPRIDEIVVVVPEEYMRKAEMLVRRLRATKVSHVVIGGRERQHSVRNGLLSFDVEPEIVLVHDAVRPLVTPSLIAEVVRATERFGAAVVGVRVKDTIKIESGGFFTTTLDRAKLWAVQTPQGFRFDILKRAHVAAQQSALLATDDAALVERLKVPVRVVEGDYRNIKITTEDDIKLAKMLLK